MAGASPAMTSKSLRIFWSEPDSIYGNGERHGFLNLIRKTRNGRLSGDLTLAARTAPRILVDKRSPRFALGAAFPLIVRDVNR
jgi:hypothetical protein